MKLNWYTVIVLLLGSLVNNSNDYLLRDIYPNDISVVNTPIGNVNGNKVFGTVNLKHSTHSLNNLNAKLCSNISNVLQLVEMTNRLIKVNNIEMEIPQANDSQSLMYDNKYNADDIRNVFY